MSEVAHISDQIKEFLEGVEGVVEATNFEKQALWGRNRLKLSGDRVRTWEDNLSGYGATVGTCAGSPVSISLLTAVISGQKILFWHATSQVVDYSLIEKWLFIHVPAYANNHTDAQNFHTIFQRNPV